jgi:hypothetical protein
MGINSVRALIICIENSFYKCKQQFAKLDYFYFSVHVMNAHNSLNWTKAFVILVAAPEGVATTTTTTLIATQYLRLLDAVVKQIHRESADRTQPEVTEVYLTTSWKTNMQ